MCELWGLNVFHKSYNINTVNEEIVNGQISAQEELHS